MSEQRSTIAALVAVCLVTASASLVMGLDARAQQEVQEAIAYADAAAPEPVASSSPTRTVRPTRRRIAVGLGILAVLVAAVVGVSLLGDGEPTATRADSTRPNPAITITGATDFDPLGDGREDPTHVAAAVDGDPATSWSTEMYQSFSRDKAGVGIVVQLGRARRVRTVSVTTVETGWDGSVYVADAPASSLQAWGKAAATGSGLGTQQRFTVDRRGGAVLLWFTRLPPGPGGERLRVAEIQVD